MSKWLRTTPITADEAERDQLFDRPARKPSPALKRLLKELAQNDREWRTREAADRRAA